MAAERIRALDVAQRRVEAVGFRRDRVELIAHAEVQRQAIGDAVVILDVKAKERVGPLAREDRARRHALEAARRAGEKLREVREGVVTPTVDRRQLVCVRVLDQRAGLQ